MQMFKKREIGMGQHFLGGIDDTPHREGELQIPHLVPIRPLTSPIKRLKATLQIHSVAQRRFSALIDQELDNAAYSTII
jgi:hypothetical protein